MTPATFNSAEPLAYFLTWTTYGTWLPGDDRWWHDKKLCGEQPPNDLMYKSAESSMKEPAFLMNADHRQRVEKTIRDHCAIRRWNLHAVSARSNHVHVVVTANGYRPQTVRDQFKSWCTRRLKEVIPNRIRFWTEGASCRWINHENDLESVVVYATEAQDRMDRE